MFYRRVGSIFGIRNWALDCSFTNSEVFIGWILEVYVVFVEIDFVPDMRRVLCVRATLWRGAGASVSARVRVDGGG